MLYEQSPGSFIRTRCDGYGRREGEFDACLHNCSPKGLHPNCGVNKARSCTFPGMENQFLTSFDKFLFF